MKNYQQNPYFDNGYGITQFDSISKFALTQTQIKTKTRNPQIVKLMNDMNTQLQKLHDQTINQNPSSVQYKHSNHTIYKVNTAQYKQLKQCFKVNSLLQFQEKYKKIKKLAKKYPSHRLGYCPQKCYLQNDDRNAIMFYAMCIFCCPCTSCWLCIMKCCFYKEEQIISHKLYPIYQKYERRAYSLLK